MLNRLLNKIQSALYPGTEAPPAQGMEPNVNAYGRQLSPAEIAAKHHRAFVGGLWNEVGRLQFEFMKAQGLLPEHKCVELRGNSTANRVPFVSMQDHTAECHLLSALALKTSTDSG